jgi:colicin import membrane protein
MPALRPAQLQKAPPKPVVKTAEVTPKKTETPKKQTEQSKDKPQEQAKIADQVAELINSEKSRGATTGQGGDPTLGKTTGKSATLTQSQLDGLVAQIKQCMSVPPGAAEAGITAQLHFSLDGQGNVTGTPDIVNAAQSQLERALASAAQRAVMRCGPYAMAPNQEVQATFDPRELT